MEIRWTRAARGDLQRLYDFLAPVDLQAAARTIRTLVGAPSRLLEYPYLGESLDEFAPRDVRRIVVGRYEMRYEVRANTVYILRIWHTREDR